jgi:hypothetical protein
MAATFRKVRRKTCKRKGRKRVWKMRRIRVKNVKKP